MTWYDSKNNCYRAFDDGVEREGILYVFCPILANEPTPGRLCEFMRTNITPIGLQPFIRPARQKGYALHIHPGKSTKSWAYRFKFSCEDSRNIFEKFNSGKDLWVEDILAEKTEVIKNITNFSFETFDKAYWDFHPKGYSKTRLKKELANNGIVLSKRAESFRFSDEECRLFINEWNSFVGKQLCDTIGRRPWYELENESDSDGRQLTAKVRHSHDYRNLKMIVEYEMLNLLAHPDGPDDAEWINYRNTPNETHKPFTKTEQQWTYVPPRLCHMFAQRYMGPDDYMISGDNM